MLLYNITPSTQSKLTTKYEQSINKSKVTRI